MTDDAKDVFAEAAELSLKRYPPRLVTITQDRAQLERLYPKAGEQNPPMNWKPCSPELLKSGVDCATAPRWSAGPVGQHYHPPGDTSENSTG